MTWRFHFLIRNYDFKMFMVLKHVWTLLIYRMLWLILWKCTHSADLGAFYVHAFVTDSGLGALQS